MTAAIVEGCRDAISRLIGEEEELVSWCFEPSQPRGEEEEGGEREGEGEGVTDSSKRWRR